MVELRLVNNTLVATYAFDGNSLRVIKVWGADRTWYLYAGTQLISEYDDAASATYSSGTQAGSATSETTSTLLYQHADHLDTRLTTDNVSNDANQQSHYPYGEPLHNVGDADPSVQRKFTTYLKDWEADSGKLNYAVARMQGSRIGRFISPDPVRGNAGNPQRLNRYSYVMNNPASRLDPNGLDPSQGGNIPIPYEHDGNVFTIIEEAIAAGVPGFIDGNPVNQGIHPWGGIVPSAPFGIGSPLNNCGSTMTGMAFTGGTGITLPGLPSLGCAMPAPSAPSCFGELRYRNVNNVVTDLFGVSHSFWHVRDSSGTQYIVNAGPSASGHLNVWPPSTNVMPRDPTQDGIRASQSTSWWTVGPSNDQCASVTMLLSAARGFPNNRIPYSNTGPNSNSAARYLGSRGGWFPPRPPGAIGWNDLIPILEY
jgi:RHS repeat-associated protein